MNSLALNGLNVWKQSLIIQLCACLSSIPHKVFTSRETFVGHTNYLFRVKIMWVQDPMIFLKPYKYFLKNTLGSISNKKGINLNSCPQQFLKIISMAHTSKYRYGENWNINVAPRELICPISIGHFGVDSETICLNEVLSGRCY